MAAIEQGSQWLKLKLGRGSTLTMLSLVQTFRPTDFDLQSYCQQFVVTNHCAAFAVHFIFCIEYEMSLSFMLT